MVLQVMFQKQVVKILKHREIFIIWNTWNLIVPYLCNVLLRLKVVYEVPFQLSLLSLKWLIYFLLKNQNTKSLVLGRNKILKNDVYSMLLILS